MILTLLFSLFTATKCFAPTFMAKPDKITLTSLSSDTTLDVVIIGGGIGGLAVASRVARDAKENSHNCKITLLEKNPDVGGRCGSFHRHVQNVGTFRHERGPSLLLLPDVYRDLFRDCINREPESFGLEMKQCIPAYKVIFEDGDAVEVGFPRQLEDPVSEREMFSRKAMDCWEVSGSKKWDSYMKATSAFLDAGLPNFIEEKVDLLSLPNFLIEALRDFARAWPLKPHSDVLDAFFESDKMKALASFQDLYVGLEPYRQNDLWGGGVLKSTAPAVFGLLAAIELHPNNKKAGVFAPVGGFQSVTDAATRMAKELGVEIQCNSLVTEIKRDGVYFENNAGVNFLNADLIIVNADMPYVTHSLFANDSQSPPIEARFDWDDAFSFSSGVISFHWSIQGELNDLNTHNVFLSAASRSDAEASWAVLRGDQSDVNADSPFNFYVHRASCTDSTAAPQGCDSIMVLVPCRTLLRNEECANLSRDDAIRLYKEQFSEATIQKARQAVLKRLCVLNSLQNPEEMIVDEVVDTPATWADQFHLAAGTPFALSHGFAQLSVTRPSQRFRKNLLFCGASTRPGNGVPLVMIGAKQVAEKAKSFLKRNRKE